LENNLCCQFKKISSGFSEKLRVITYFAALIILLKNKIIKLLVENKFNVHYNKVYYFKKFRATSGDDFVLDLFCMAKKN
jgi:hypothetical protein